ncbi:MAG: alpha/beta hydrolase [Chloroflexi bacterium]|nr:alpha/beta hydrolase [Chloroflexota bacterium]
MKQAYVELPEGRVHYRCEGDGKTVLLLHMTPLSSIEYAGGMPLLAGTYRVLAMDTPGYGESEAPPRPYQVEDYARVAADFLKAHGVSRAYIAGHLTGAAIGAELAASYPEMVEKLVLTSYPFMDAELRQARKTAPAYQLFCVKEDGAHLMEIWNRWRSEGARPETNQMMVLGYLQAGKGAMSAFQAMLQYNAETRLPLVKCPTLLVSGGAEDKYHAAVAHLEGLIPDTRSRVIPGSRHFIPAERPQEFVQALRAFFG